MRVLILDLDGVTAHYLAAARAAMKFPVPANCYKFSGLTPEQKEELLAFMNSREGLMACGVDKSIKDLVNVCELAGIHIWIMTARQKFTSMSKAWLKANGINFNRYIVARYKAAVIAMLLDQHPTCEFIMIDDSPEHIQGVNAIGSSRAKGFLYLRDGQDYSFKADIESTCTPGNVVERIMSIWK